MPTISKSSQSTIFSTVFASVLLLGVQRYINSTDQNTDRLIHIEQQEARIEERLIVIQRDLLTHNRDYGLLEADVQNVSQRLGRVETTIEQQLEVSL